MAVLLSPASGRVSTVGWNDHRPVGADPRQARQGQHHQARGCDHQGPGNRPVHGRRHAMPGRSPVAGHRGRPRQAAPEHAHDVEKPRSLQGLGRQPHRDHESAGAPGCPPGGKDGREVVAGPYSESNGSLHIYGQDYKSKGMGTFFTRFPTRESFVKRARTSVALCDAEIIPQLRDLLTESTWRFPRPRSISFAD